MKKFVLYKSPVSYFAAPVGVEPLAVAFYKRIKTFTVGEPYVLNARAYAQVYTGLVKLGYVNPDFTIARISPQRYRVDITYDDVSGVWDTQLKTFVD